MKISINTLIGSALGLGLAIPFSGSFMNSAECMIVPDKPARCGGAFVSDDTPVIKVANTKPVANNYPKNTLNWLMTDAGFKGQQMKDMSAILIGESGIGNNKINAKAHNCDASTGDDSRGLGQVNLLGPLMKRLDTYNLKSPQALYDPKRNMQITYELAQTPQGYKHWGSYNQGTYLKFYGRNPVIVSVDNPNCPA